MSVELIILIILFLIFILNFIFFIVFFIKIKTFVNNESEKLEMYYSTVSEETEKTEQEFKTKALELVLNIEDLSKSCSKNDFINFLEKNNKINNDVKKYILNLDKLKLLKNKFYQKDNSINS